MKKQVLWELLEREALQEAKEIVKEIAEEMPIKLPKKKATGKRSK
jgi:hypothetical protein